MIKSGRLRDLITIEKVVVTRDELNGEVRSWQFFAHAWAEVAHLSSRELSRVRMFSSQITTKFTIRYMAGLDNTVRIVIGDAVYSVSEIIEPDSSRRMIELLGYAEVTETADV